MTIILATFSLADQVNDDNTIHIGASGSQADAAAHDSLQPSHSSPTRTRLTAHYQTSLSIPPIVEENEEVMEPVLQQADPTSTGRESADIDDTVFLGDALTSDSFQLVKFASKHMYTDPSAFVHCRCVFAWMLDRELDTSVPPVGLGTRRPMSRVQDGW